MIIGTHGIFRGGQVTLNTAQPGIDVGPTILRTLAGENVGFGQGGRHLAVIFSNGTSGFDFTASRPDDFHPPDYVLTIGALAGGAYVCYDPNVEVDVILRTTPLSTDTVFAHVTWPAGATLVSQLTLDFALRQESRVLSALNPMGPGDLYHPGSDFGDISFNKPLVAMSILSEILQGELRARSEDAFEVVLLHRADIVGLGPNLAVAPFKVYLRTTDAPTGLDNFTVIDTRYPSAFTLDVTTIPDQRVSIWVDPATGLVGAGTSYTPALGVLCAFGDVPVGAVGLQDVRFVLATEIGLANGQSGAEAALLAKALKSGFVAPVVIQPSPVVPKAVNVASNIALVNGIQFLLANQQIFLPDAPMNGDRLDLLYLEVYRTVETLPPSDGSFYVPLATLGYLSTKARLVVAPGVTRDRPEAMMQTVTSIGGGSYIQDPAGHFKSVYGPSYDGESWALPLALFFRLNQSPWTYTNLVGGGVTGGNLPTRPDKKRHDLLSPDEFESLAPVVALDGINHAAVFGAWLDAVLKGQHPGMMGAASLDPSYFSKKPLQVDAIGGAAVPGANMLGVPDGLRRQWSANPQPYWVGTNFAAVADYSDIAVTYEEGAGIVILKSPLEATLFLGGGDQPNASLLWADNGSAVVLAGPWTVGLDGTSASAVLDKTAPNYELTGRVSISFMTLQAAAHYLGQIPLSLPLSLLDGAPFLIADVGAGAVQLLTTGGKLATLSPIGDPLKGDALLVHVTATADGSDILSLPTAVEGMNVIGAVSATNGPTSLAIKTFRLGGGANGLQLTAPLAAGVTVDVQLAVAGRLANYRPRNLSLDEFATAGLYPATVSGGQATYPITLPALKVLKGALGWRHDGTNRVAGVYVNNRLYPATVTGIDRNLIHVTLALSPIDYGQLSPADAVNWQLDGPSSSYVLVPGSYALLVPGLASGALDPLDTLVLAYSYASLPFDRVLGGEVFTLAHRGLVMVSSSSAGNQHNSFLAPATERFPLVRGQVKSGNLLSPPVTSFTDVLALAQSGPLPLDGTTFSVDGTLGFMAGVSPGAGFVIWAALVKENGNLRAFVYVSEGPSFTVSDPTRAFVSYPLALYVE